MGNHKPYLQKVEIAAANPQALADFYRKALHHHHDAPAALGDGSVRMTFPIRCRCGLCEDSFVVDFVPASDLSVAGKASLWFSYLSWEVSYDLLLDMGAESIQPPTAGPDGTFAKVRDPEGNIIGLMEYWG